MFAGSPISRGSKKEAVVALSSCEAEYIAASMAACQATLMQELKMKGEEPIKLLVDNKSAIYLAKPPISHGRNKHIETRFHFLRDQVNIEKLILEYCSTNVLTKPLKRQRFAELRNKFAIVCLVDMN